MHRPPRAEHRTVTREAQTQATYRRRHADGTGHKTITSAPVSGSASVRTARTCGRGLVHLTVSIRPAPSCRQHSLLPSPWPFPARLLPMNSANWHYHTRHKRGRPPHPPQGTASGAAAPGDYVYGLEVLRERWRSEEASPLEAQTRVIRPGCGRDQTSPSCKIRQPLACEWRTVRGTRRRPQIHRKVRQYVFVGVGWWLAVAPEVLDAAWSLVPWVAALIRQGSERAPAVGETVCNEK